ncbi:16S rRNA methyltransferase [Rhodothermaceae bacterium RA]|nr:16S rRNA methyltransferase [Rhodothermaceae bacterium RA]
MTTTFYAPPDRIRDGMIDLPGDETRHAVRVLRMRPGDALVVVDGVGGWYEAELVDASKSRAVARVIRTRREVGESPFEITLALALLKQRNRFETALEKAVELGVRRFVPLVTARTEKGGLKRSRAESILIAAMKQSGRSRLMDLSEPVTFDAALRLDVDLKLVAHEQADPASSLVRVLAGPAYPERVLLMIGPEGGFTGEEVTRARSAGGRVVSLGPRRLRAETAALAAASALMLWGDAAPTSVSASAST